MEEWCHASWCLVAGAENRMRISVARKGLTICVDAMVYEIQPAQLFFPGAEYFLRLYSYSDTEVIVILLEILKGLARFNGNVRVPARKEKESLYMQREFTSDQLIDCTVHRQCARSIP
ncbi:hypothetical protein BTUL_0009g00010 [Botrytis tulipae]|uniref:Uncharacterized protein n=1 Tax=Botrytis tulipae TaxID=87230 RepID=A0A4Z1F6S0_9HELO|nr:hypothetical protein BTUL_0009g00010 [Botrytis tulipae]